MRANNARLLAAFLRRLSRELDSLSNDDLEFILSSDRPVLLFRADRVSTSARIEHTPRFDPYETLQELRGLDSRDAGVELLKTRAPTRDDLIAVARLMDLPVNKRHAIDQVLDKVIEATIGYRIRSAAIRGENTGGGSALGREGRDGNTEAEVNQQQPQLSKPSKQR